MGPRYVQIADALRRDIDGGKYPPGSQLPSLDELKAIFDVSEGTVTAALKSLDNEGRTASRQGARRIVLGGAQTSANLSSKVVAALRDGIRNGAYAPGSSAPSEEELATEHGVSRSVVRDAFAELEESGEVINRPGRRRRFADSAPPDDSRYESIAAEIRSRIANGTYVAGQPLPSQSALGREYSASRVTIRASLALLEAEGIIKRNAKNIRCVA